MPVHEVLTPNQVVSYNLARARALRGLTQAQAVDLLAPHLGESWSNVVLSAAERSITGKRVRQFSADEIVAFARAFELPITWFFLPPAADVDPEGRWPLVCPAKGDLGEADPTDDTVLVPAELLDLTFNIASDRVVHEMGERLESYSLHGRDVETARARGALVDHVAKWSRGLVADELATGGRWSLAGLRSALRRLVAQIDALVEDMEEES